MINYHSKLETLLATGVGMLSAFAGSAAGLIQVGHDAFSAFVVGGAGALGGLVVKKTWELIKEKRQNKKTQE